MNYYSVSSPDILESLAIPLQQVARVVADYGADVLTEEQYELLDEVIDVEKIPEIYYCRISDPIKNAIRAKGNLKYLEQHMPEYLELYFSVGINNPRAYLSAFILQTNGYYAPKIRYWVNHYPYALGEEELGISMHSLLPQKLTEHVLSISEDYPDIPVYGSLWYIGTYVWLMFITAGYALYKKINLLPFLPVFAIWCTLLIASPVHAEFRYSYPIAISIPFLLCTAVYCQETTKD